MEDEWYLKKENLILLSSKTDSTLIGVLESTVVVDDVESVTLANGIVEEKELIELGLIIPLSGQQ